MNFMTELFTPVDSVLHYDIIITKEIHISSSTRPLSLCLLREEASMGTQIYLQKVIKIIFSLLLAAYVMICFFHPVEIEDVWWHLSTGRWITQNKTVPHQDPFSFRELDTPWILTQWMGSTSLYHIYQWGGINGLKAFRSLFYLLVTGLFFVYALRKISFSMCAVLTVLLAYGLLGKAHLRPLSFNFVFVQVFLICLMSFEKTGRLKYLLFLLLCGILWGNFHLGSFVYGFLILLIFLFSSFVQMFNTRGSSRDFPIQKRQTQTLLGTTLLYPLVFLVSPYGLDGLLYPLKVFFQPMFINFYSLNNVVQEMKPPSYLLHFSGAGFLVLLLIGVICIFISERNKFRNTLLLAVSFFMFLHSARASSFFAILSVYAAVDALSSARISLQWRNHWLRRLLPLMTICLLGLFMITRCVLAQNRWIFANNQAKKLRSLSYEPNNPVALIEVLQKNQISGNVFTSDTAGNLLLWKGHPQLKPFIDGRQLDLALFQEYQRILSSPEENWPQAVKDFDFKVVLLDTQTEQLAKFVQYVHRLPQWQLIGTDDSFVLFVKRDEFALKEEIAVFEENLSKPSEVSRKLHSPPFHPAPQRPRPVHGFLSRGPSHIDLISEGTNLYYLGYWQAAEMYFKKADQVTGLRR